MLLTNGTKMSSTIASYGIIIFYLLAEGRREPFQSFLMLIKIIYCQEKLDNKH